MISVRPLEARDADAARRMGWEAFGEPSTPPSAPAAVDQAGMTWFGAFAEDAGGGEGDLVARIIDREYEACFGGVALPTSGIAGVTVRAEDRGRGALTPLFAATLAHARRRGAVLSTLFPTAPGIYRRFGYEVVADYVTVELATTALAAVGPATSTTVRRATTADFEAVREVYDRWAIEQNGPLTRRGVSFPASAEEFLASFTGVSVAVDDRGRVVGYASWNRGQGYGEGVAIEVLDLLADTADGLRALLRMIGSFASAVTTTRIDTSGDDLVRLLLPSLPWRVTHSSPYMLKILDVAGAITARRYPPGLTVDLTFSLAGDTVTGQDGSYRLDVVGGRARCTTLGPAGPGDPAGPVLSHRGLALLYAGSQSTANLRASGHLSGGDRADDLNLDALFSGRQAHIRDYF